MKRNTSESILSGLRRLIAWGLENMDRFQRQRRILPPRGFSAEVYCSSKTI